MPLVQTRGAASAQGFGEFAQVTAANYIEDVFSTYLYTGNGATGQTITNNIDLSTKGGLTWIKIRELNGGETSHRLYDTLRGAGNSLQSEAAAATSNQGNSLTAFNSNGFTLGGGYLGTNGSGYKYTSWTFREQPKFFDIVTYTGNGTNRSIAHNIGATPGFVMVKRTDTSGDWYCGITAFGGSDYLVLNSTAARATDSTIWNNTAPTSTVFTVGTNSGVNASGGTYVAYLFANNAGGFGLTGTDSVISTTLVSSAGSGDTTVNLGFEPQFLMLKKTATTSNWFMYDIMRGMSYTTGAATLVANTDGVETTGIVVSPTSTGFTAALDNSFTYFCLAIRRGPMKVPTTGTSVFSPNAVAGSAGDDVTTNFPVDMQIWKYRSGATNNFVVDRLRGVSTNNSFTGQALFTNLTNAETTDSGSSLTWGSTGFRKPLASAGNDIFWNFRRAPGFMDVVCYTGTGSARTVSHNLGVVPEMMIFKARNTGSDNWFVYAAPLGPTKGLYLNQTNAAITSPGVVNDTAPTASVFTTSAAAFTNINTTTYVAYLFATCAGVSKVGSYTGTGTTQTINCGFTAGSRFVMIKRTDSTGDWYVWDSARGIIAGNDPYLLLNSTAAEVTNTDYVDTYSAGFEISSTAPAAINANGGSFIFLAIS